MLIRVLRVNVRMVVMLISFSVYGSALLISVVIGMLRLLLIDMFQCLVTIVFRYFRYCNRMFLFGSNSNSVRMVCNCLVVMIELFLLSCFCSVFFGLFGIICGMKKLSVIVAQSVSMKNPRRCSRYFTVNSFSCSFWMLFADYFWADFEYRLVSICPVFGMLYGVGWVYGLFCVGQFSMFLVLYWY